MTPTSDRWEQGNAYERYIGRWSREVAPVFLAWLDRAPDLAWLDVGCGTGALCAAILDGCAPASVTGIEPSDGFRRTAAANLEGKATIVAGDAAEISLPDKTIDVVVSGLVLNFLPDPGAALAEMKRLSRPGAAIAAYVWDYSGKMEFLRAFWDAAITIDPAAATKDEGVRFPLCRPEALRALFDSAELAEVDATAIDVPTRFASFDDLWQPFLAGTGPAPAYAMGLAEPQRAKLKDTFHSLVPVAADGSISLTARAWAVQGSVRSR